MKNRPSSLPSMPGRRTLHQLAPAEGAGNVSDRTFFREVDDAMQQEKLALFWHNYRGFLIAGVAVLVAGTAAWQGWQAYQRHQSLSLAEEYHTWSNLPSEDAKAKALPELLHNSRAGYRALAIFAQARNAGKTDPKAADRAFGQIYNDASQPQWLRELARLNAALGLLGREDTLAQEHLSLLVQVPGQSDKNSQTNPANPSAIYPLALEQLALLAQRQGDVPTARNYTTRLLGLSQIPADLRQRALARLGELTPNSR